MEALNDFIKIIKEHIQYKPQLRKLAKSDIIKTYRGAALGWSWAIIKPTVTIFVYWFGFEIGLRSGKEVNGFPYFLWLIAGFIPWFYISDMLSGGTEAIRRYSYLVTKMKFPVSTIPTFISMAKIVINIMLIGIMMIIYICFGFRPDVYWLQAIIYTGLSFLISTAWALFSSLLAAISKDFANLVKSFIPAVLWLSGILWNPNTIKVAWLKKALNFNPVTFIVNGYRNCFINKIWIWEEPKKLIYFLIIYFSICVLALWAYRKVRKDIPDVL